MQGKLKQKHLESFLQDMEGFDLDEKNKWSLEQHMTTPEIAAQMIYLIYQREQNLDQQVSADFGCGTGMLMAGMLYIGTMQVIGLEIDTKYIGRTQEQLMEKFEDESLFELINVNLKQFTGNPDGRSFDLVVMNPPFGTKDEGIDLIFLEKARDHCLGNIYSLHKTSTREFLQKKAESWGYTFEAIHTFKFPLPKRFNKYHKKEMAFTEVDFICLSPGEQMKKQIEEEQENRKQLQEERQKLKQQYMEQKQQEEEKEEEEDGDDEDQDDGDDDDDGDEEDEEEEEEEQY